MTIDKFAEQFRLKIRLDECGDKIIPGRRGHLYVDRGQVCAIWLDARPMQPSRLAKLGGKVWQGSISGEGNRRAQDAKVIGILPEQYRLAIRLVGARPKQILSAARQEVLARARANSPIGKKAGAGK